MGDRKSTHLGRAGCGYHLLYGTKYGVNDPDRDGGLHAGAAVVLAELLLWLLEGYVTSW